MPDREPAVPVRRHLIAVGTGRYAHLPEPAHLPGVADDIRKVTALFESFGYRAALPGLADYATAEHIKRALSHWCRDAKIGENDIVALYYAGHGLVDDRHYLLCWDSDENNLAASALPTEDLVRILTRTGLRNLLLILDTCYGGAGSGDAAQVALRTLSRRLTSDATATGMWFLSSARAWDEADDGTFVAALPVAIEAVAARTGQRQRFLDLHDLVGELNELFRRSGTGQRAELATGLSTGVAPFLPHGGYRPDLPPEGTDLEMQRLAAKRELAEHFGPRSRGVDFESEQGTYFSGRTAALARLVAWLTTPGGDGKGRVVTGKPGCGKSAVLSRVVALSDGDYRRDIDLSDADPGTLIPEGTVDVAVHARHKRLEELVARIAAGLRLTVEGTGDLLREISRRAQAGIKTVIVIDALDEAGSGTSTDAGGRGEPRRIARELLRPLSEIRGVHLLVGGRREVVRSLGPAMELINLDEPELLGDSDIARYVVKMLMAPDRPDIETPYRGREELAETVGQAVAERAAGVFLVARMTGRSLRLAADPVDTAVPGWADRLPSEIGDAFDDYLARFGPDEPKVRRLLAPLAFAEGQGLPRGLWPQLASAISATVCTDDDVDWLLQVADAYIAEVMEHERSVYRLYHQTLAEHLRQDPRRPAAQAQRRIVEVLVGVVPGHDSGVPRWFDAHPYVRANLPIHAAAGGRVDELAQDPGFLLAADQPALLSALAEVRTDAGRHIRTAYEQVAHRIADGDLAQRAAYLQLSARRCDAPRLADDIDRLGLALPWVTRWADWSRTGAHRRLLGHQGWVRAVAIGELDGRPIAVSGDGEGSARLWDLAALRQIGAPLVGGPDSSDGVAAIALVEVDDYSLALLGCADGGVRVCDLSTGRETRPPLRGHTNAVMSIAVGALRHGPVALTGSRDGTARLWDLRNWCEVGEPITGHRTVIRAVALGELAGRPVAVTGGDDGRVQVWDLATREQIGESLTGHTREVYAVTLGQLGDRTVALTGSRDGTIQLWDLTTGRQLGEPIPAHRFGVNSVALGTAGGRAIAISGGQDGLVRLWDLATRQQLDQPLTGHTSLVQGVGLGTVGGRPVAISGGGDRTVRVWDLAADQPRGGHVKPVTVLGLDPTGSLPYLVTGSEDGTARLWDLHRRAETGHPLTGHAGAVTSVVLGDTPTGPVVVTGDEHGTVWVWQGELSRAACTPLAGHTNRVTALCLATVGGQQLLLSGSTDGTVRVWDLGSRSAVGPPLTGHHADVDLLAAGDIDGQPTIIAASSGGRVSLWDLHTRKPLALRVGRHEYSRTVAVTVLAGRPVAVRQLRSNTLVGWDVLREEPVTAELVGHTGSVSAATIAWLDGQPIALTRSADRSARLWNLRTGTTVATLLSGHYSSPDAVALGMLDGRPIAATSTYDTVQLWDAASGVPLGEPLIGHAPSVATLAVATYQDGPKLVTGSYDGAIRIRDLATGSQVATRLVDSWYGTRALRAATDAGGRAWLLSGGGDRTIRIWDLAGRREIGQLFDQSPDPYSIGIGISALAAGEWDGRFIAISGSDVVTPRVWDVESRVLLAELTGHTAQIWSVDIADCDGELLAATGAGDSTVRLWRLSDFTPFGAVLAGHDGDVSAVVFTRIRGRVAVVTGDDEGVLRCWDVHSQQPLNVPFAQHDLHITCLVTGTVGGRDVLGVGSNDGMVRVWRLADETLLTELNLETNVNELVFAPGDLLCVGTDSGLVAFALRG